MRRTAAVSFSLLWILLCAALGAQLPELVVQYSQRLGGATDEVASYLRKFDEGARKAEYSRTAAIERMIGSDDRLNREQGNVAKSQVERFDRLSRQQAAMGSGVTLSAVYSFLTDYDEVILNKAISQFVPGLSLSPIGLIFIIVGALIGAGVILISSTLTSTASRIAAP